MPYTKTENVAMYEGGDWSGLVKTVPNCSSQQAQRIAMLDPQIRFFFFCREYMVLTNPAWSGPRTFNPGDAVFFTGEPWWGSAPQCDGYVKDGMATAYIGSLNANDPTSPLVAAQYTTAQGLNAVDIVIIFAANLNLALKDDLVRLAPDVPLQSGDFLAVAHQFYTDVFKQSVAALQAKGITVLLSFLNNWDAAGWSNFDPTTTAGQQNAQNFALQLQTVVQAYGFDGIDIDDEYAVPESHTPEAVAMVASMFRALMPDAILSKAVSLYSDARDIEDFDGTYNGKTLADSLTYAWDMDYSQNPPDLDQYVAKGMAPLGMALGYQGDVADPAGQVATLKAQGNAGFMVYAFENPTNQAVMGQLVNAWCGPGNWNQN